MRWSHPSTFFIFAVLFATEVAVSAPINVDLDELLEARSPGRVTRSTTRRTEYRPPVLRSATNSAKPKADDPPKASTSKVKDDDKSQLFTAGDFKAASETYRKQAKTELHRTGQDGFVEKDASKGLGPGKQAGEHFEIPKLLRIDTESFVTKIIRWRRRLWLKNLTRKVTKNREWHLFKLQLTKYN